MQQASKTYRSSRKTKHRISVTHGPPGDKRLYIAHGTTWHIANKKQFKLANDAVVQASNEDGKGYNQDVMDLDNLELHNFEIGEVIYNKENKLLTLGGSELSLLNMPRNSDRS